MPGALLTEIRDVHDAQLLTALREQSSRKILYRTPLVKIPGIVASAAFADGDAVGVKFNIGVPTSGTITTTLLSDLDDEGLSLAFILFDDDFDGGTDNSAFDMTDANELKYCGFLTVSNFQALNDNQLGQSSTVLDYVAPTGRLWVQAVARGAVNIGVSTDYGISLILEDHS